MSVSPNLKSFLSSAKIHPSIFTVRPDYRAVLIVAENIPPSPSDATSDALLVEASLSAQTSLAQTPILQIPHIAAWRETYKAFGANPKKTKNSLEALMRRAEGGLPRVNRLTDVYNAVSVKHQVPIGGEDVERYEGAPVLKRAEGSETFETAAGGEKVVERVDEGEVVWCDDKGVTCRRWNWRQCTRTALSEETTKVLFILDALEPCGDEKLEAAVEELVGALKGLSGEVRAEWRVIRAP
ncbi:B3/B4 tRNA-binding domain-containing protein [Corynespora cassiicola Philippines]|uniref:B3/B4 tRNA-binding domain-containing protein n=1 Tax=Corynespora cassiicola Philippines TaxID=1448308 RepID=A0A2T2P1D7_CORCC|nr:B3/B4 tRNA-binding domain-containing protein [Corynespora cassiicola Philippines]